MPPKGQYKKPLNRSCGFYFEYSGEQTRQRLPDPAKIKPRELELDGDFRSEECVTIHKQADGVH
jgi:hypothetical protein